MFAKMFLDGQKGNAFAGTGVEDDHVLVLVFGAEQVTDALRCFVVGTVVPTGDFVVVLAYARTQAGEHRAS
ncbi:protein of unknown function [Acidithiobacillus ferrivorans]|uniref:Uncharacterized protein n=1 Tax=Acidithiobacillus ferrivorans TaxID=160808 RepID=A0ABY1MMB6_9PROT|nr:protein of unknown function [Acidithiobacillus ferrivorans]